MNMVKKYVDTQMKDLVNPLIKEEPLFLNGMTVTEQGSPLKILLYQEPFSPIIRITLYDGDNELYTDRMMFNEQQEVWIVIPPKNE